MAYMDKQRLNQKKRETMNRIFVYVIMVLAVISIVAALMLVIRGYRFNSFDGKIEQGGLLQFDSRPSGAEVTVGATLLSNKTPNKITVSAGDHTVKMTHEGYEDWSKDVTIKPGSVLWLNYTRMVPRVRPVESVFKFDAVSSAIVSNNKKHIALIDNPSLPAVSIASIDTDKPETEKLELPATSYTQPAEGKTQEFRVRSWDESSRYVLVTHAFDDDKLEWLVVDTRGDRAPINLTTSLGVAIKHAEFTLASNQALYVLTDQHELRRIELDARTLSGPLVSEVAQFAQYDRSTVTFTTLMNAVSKKRSVGYLTRDAKAPRMVRSYADDGAAPLHIRIAKYYGKTYVVTGYGETLDIQVGDLPASDATDVSSLRQVASLTVPGGIQSVGFSPGEQRFVYATGASSVAVYDLELLTTGMATIVDAPRAVQWGDGKHLLTASDGKLDMMDFDGMNRHTLMKNTVDLPGVISPNDKYVYGFTRTETGVELSRIKLLID